MGVSCSDSINHNWVKLLSIPELLIAWRLQVQSWLHGSNSTGILNTSNQLWLMEAEQVTPHGLNQGCGSKFRVVFWVWQETPEEGRRTYQLKCCEYNNKDEDNSPKKPWMIKRVSLLFWFFQLLFVNVSLSLCTNLLCTW